MYLYIEIVDVVANAFIELLKKKSPKRILLFSELDAYGARVIEYLNNKDDDIHAVYVVSQESQYSICADYSDFFLEYEGETGERGIELKEGVEPMAIWDRFCTALSLKVIMAFKGVSIVG